ncbi:hypothetical protein DUNSADRAFT_16416 [Dunaliella salina]|uniref:Secreted protein n=1 Tax=Dunaliella salina TaxID=3046 RepID=A0ABQ7G3K7_DUNSA|nr:hypothetical protein DUNSADRAFT_16416 [Dunaliella salina]|eukprot:KAF5829194.1 hypothetical protein DUNSADRAFT_16416 [Dunaliella salina]
MYIPASVLQRVGCSLVPAAWCPLPLCSFTRTNKLQLWERVLASSGLASLDPHTAALTASGLAGPVHLQLLNCILMRAFSAYPEAACVKYTFLVPPWLFGWSHKWGFLGKEICVLAVNAFHPDMEFCSPSEGQAPTRCIYIPVFAQ